MHEQRESALLCRVRGLLCALPLDHVEETMRPMAVEPIAGVPAFLQGLAVVRGSAVPVVDAALLLGGDNAPRPTRFVTVKAGRRRIALAVDAVIGIRAISPRSLEALPLLFQGSHLDAVSAIGTVDSELMLVLRSARLVPEDAWAAIDADGSA
ncbi:MAG TPA: chemotaxis protein CheW [Vicinamibacterales bacterium]|jgi:purine-binding chemotaxis protein CheW|nr:chemotaxis protein CheW [Vicinamibacterales bacterium]